MIIKSYCGYINDREKLKKSSSGGLATAMAEQIIANGNVVYGVSYTADFRGAEYIRAHTTEDIRRLRGSKYIKAVLNKNILDCIVSDLNDGRMVLFIGLPCDVNSVKTYIARKNLDGANLLCVDLICHGAAPAAIAKEYIGNLEHQFQSKIVDFSVRYKKPYWTPAYLFARFENKKEYAREFYNTDYGIAFSMMSRPVCYNCHFKGENHKSDITIGDYWGAEKGDDGYNKYGSSVAFVHTEQGDLFMKSLTNFNLYTADLEKALDANPMYLDSIENTAEKEAFRKNFNDKGLSYAVSQHLSIMQKISKKMPRCIRSLRKKVKRIFRCIRPTPPCEKTADSAKE